MKCGVRGGKEQAMDTRLSCAGGELLLGVIARLMLGLKACGCLDLDGGAVGAGR